MRLDCDIAIVGGGLVGASLACAIESIGLDTVVIERVPPRAEAQPSYDDRTLALSHSSCMILDGLGLWRDLEAHATPIREIFVSEPGRPGRVHLRSAETEFNAFGNVVEARAFGQVVMDRLGSGEGIRMLCPANVESVLAGDEFARVQVRQGDRDIEVRAALVVAADGAASAVREMLGIDAVHHDYRQTALICNFTPELPHRNRAWELLTATGPFAVLPHVGDRCGLVWSLSAQEAEARAALPDDEFAAQAQARFGDALGAFTRIGRRSSYPLKLVRSRRDTAQRVVIMGNAAHAIHPVGAQGFNLGLRDVAVLAEVLSSSGKGDPGAAAVLAAYSDWRKPDQDQTVAWSDGLVRIFASNAPATAALRTTGFMLHALIPPLRRKLISQAMGYRGRTPRLAMGLPLESYG